MLFMIPYAVLLAVAWGWPRQWRALLSLRLTLFGVGGGALAVLALSCGDAAPVLGPTLSIVSLLVPALCWWVAALLALFDSRARFRRVLAPMHVILGPAVLGLLYLLLLN